MSDYLARLAARMQREEHVIRPRLATRFEPVPDESNLGPLPVSAWLEEEWFPDGGPVVVREPADPARSAARAGDPLGEMLTASLPAQPGPVGPVRGLDVETRASEVDRGGIVPVDRSTPQPRRPIEPLEMTGQNTDLISDATGPADRRDPIPGEPSPPARTAPIRPTVRPAEEPGTVVFARPMSAALEAAIPSGTMPVAPRARAEDAPLRYREPAVTPARAHEERPPDIQITIGRIEVRAVPEGRPPREAPRPGPRVTLDDYLKSRTRGS